MLLSPTRTRTIAAAVMMLFAVQVSAARQDNAVEVKTPKDVKQIIQKRNRFTPDEFKAEQARRVNIQNRANQIFTLLSGEILLQKGDAGTALATYMMMLNNTKSPEVAERALEMAVSLNAFQQAEMIYQKWREIEPVPGNAQKRMTWLRNILLGQGDKTLNGLDDILANASEEQNQRIFLLLAQAAIQQPGLAEKASSQVHKEALKYKDLPEAAIADVIFSAQGGKKKHAIAALQRLAGLDAEMLPPTLLTLRLMAQRSPEILNGFFDQTDTRNLSPVWQELEIVNLISNKQNDKAYARLRTLLENNPNPDLYIQAALLANNRKDDISTIINYLDKAYNIGTSEQQSRAALIGAMAYADVKDYPKAKQWLAKVVAPSYVFDKAVFSASLEAEQGNGKAALAEARRAQSLPEQEGRYFGSKELQRVTLFALSKHDNLQEALSELNKMLPKISRQPDAAEQLPDALYQRAMIYDRMGDQGKAIADLRRVVELAPDNANGLNALGYILLSPTKKNLDEAFKLIQAAYQIEPENPAINDSLGWAYFLKDDVQTALPYLQYAFEKYPDAEVAAHLGEALWASGDQEKAKKIWTDSLKGEGDMKILRETMKRFGVEAAPKATKKAQSGRSVKSK